MIFTTLTLAQMGNALVVRSERESIFRIGFTSNPLLLASIAITFALQLLIIYLPSLQGIFKTVPLTWWEFTASLALASTVFWVVEIAKWIIRVSKR